MVFFVVGECFVAAQSGVEPADPRGEHPITGPAPVEQAPARPLVASAFERDSIAGYTADQHTVQAMVDTLVITITGQKDIRAGWRSLVSPEDKIGIKVSTSAAPYLSTHREVVEAIVRGLEAAGMVREKVVVWDRAQSGLRSAGFLGENHGYRVRWIEPITGYNRDAVVSGPVLGKLIWGDLQFEKKGIRRPWDARYEGEQLSSASHLGKILSQEVTKVINVPVLAGSESVGLAGALYNMTVPNVDNWRRFVGPPSYGDPGLAELYADPRVGGKVVLTLMDGLMAQYAGGPGFDPNYALPHATLYASRDPVALDATVLALLDQWRTEARLPLASKRAGYVQSAAELGLGSAAAERIEHRKLP